jgi:transcriptional antiterminator NusG
MKWYVVQAYSGYENKVKLSLEERIKQAGMEGRFGDILIPKENVQESRGGQRRLSSRTFYPGYIFVQMDLDDQTWHLIKDTPKVNGFVGGRHPSPVPEREIAAIEQQVEDGAAKPKPRVEFEKGDHVRVTDGAFANFTGAIEEVNHEKHKVRVLVSIFGRATPVELKDELGDTLPLRNLPKQHNLSAKDRSDTCLSWQSAWPQVPPATTGP